MSVTKTLAEQDCDPDPETDSLPVLVLGSFIFVRHGQTHWNVEGRMQGHSNHRWTRLTPLGIKQAEEAATILKAVGVQHLVCSGLHRAQQTTDIIWQQTGGTLRMDADLNERCFGKLEGLTIPEVVAAVGAQSQQDFEQNFHGYLPSCAEDNEMLIRRVVPALNRWRELYKGETVAFVSHGAVYRVLREYVTGVAARSKNGVPFRFASEDGAHWAIDELTRAA